MESRSGGTQNAPFSTGAILSRGKRLSSPWPMADAMASVMGRWLRPGIIAKPLLDEAGECGPEQDAPDPLLVHQLEPRTGFPKGGQGGDRLSHDLSGRLAFGVAALEVLLLGARRRHLFERRVRDVVAD